MRPAAWRYPVTAFEPGAREVFTSGETVRPAATALRARSPAPTMTVGFEVFVHEVIAAIATEPVRIGARWPSTSTKTGRYPPSSDAGSGTGSSGVAATSLASAPA